MTAVPSPRTPVREPDVDATDPAIPGARGWAVVTGASSGLGEAFAVELGRRGHPVLLVGRNRARLEEVAARIPLVRWLAVDLATEQGIAAVETAVRDPRTPVELLVNAAGVGPHGEFVDQSPRAIQDTVTVNLLALVRITRSAVVPMIGRGAGGVINLSSSASDRCVPEAAVYAATKTAIDNLSRSLVADLERHGIVVTTVRPGFTRTAFHQRNNVDTTGLGTALDPERVVAAALRAHASRRRRSVTMTGRAVRDGITMQLSRLIERIR